MDVRAGGAVLHPGLPGLTEAHEAGIVHRDLKPENLMVVHRREARAREGSRLRSREAARAGAEERGISSGGQVIGTPYYMAPEQVAARISTRAPISTAWARRCTGC